MGNEKFRMHFPNSSAREASADMFNDHLDELTLMNFNLSADLIVHKLKLEIPWALFKQFNPSANLPYHNLYHTECLVANVFEGAVFEDIPSEYWRPLVLGGICHDAKHTGGNFDDAENVRRAKEFLAAVINMCKYTDEAISDWEYKVAERVVDVTQYPYVRGPVDHVEKIIRDADLMQAYEGSESKLIKSYLGLKTEVELQRNATYTMTEWAEGNRQFLNGVVWHTEWAKQKAIKLDWEAHKERLVQVLKSI